MSFHSTTCYDDICAARDKTMTFSRISFRMEELFGWLNRAVSVYRQRRRLSQLSKRELIDLGLSRMDVQIESNRPFWDLPKED